jgi:glycosyltransferase involved in cell wall biosynthesis
MLSKKNNVLFILHYSPPVHGASKVGDTIVKSEFLKEKFSTKYIKIKSSQKIDQIGRFSFRKVFALIELFFKIIYTLLIFRPKKIYYTASSFGFAFYRDLVVTLPIKIYTFFKKSSIFYHYHAKGVEDFTTSSKLKKYLTNYFVKNVVLIFISPLMKNEIRLLNTYKDVLYLKNGVPNMLSDSEFESISKDRSNSEVTRVLYLSNMIREKGYDVVLSIAKEVKEKNINKFKFDFAGGWASKEEEIYFKDFVHNHNLENLVVYHGLVKGEKKKTLFSKANLFIFPSSYKKEVFPLAVLEALSYGLPVLAFDIGAVSEIINKFNGKMTNKECIFETLIEMIKTCNTESYYNNVRHDFLKKYTVDVFEQRLFEILKSE